MDHGPSSSQPHPRQHPYTHQQMLQYIHDPQRPVISLRGDAATHGQFDHHIGSSAISDAYASHNTYHYPQYTHYAERVPEQRPGYGHPSEHHPVQMQSFPLAIPQTSPPRHSMPTQTRHTSSINHPETYGGLSYVRTIEADAILTSSHGLQHAGPMSTYAYAYPDAPALRVGESPASSQYRIQHDIPKPHSPLEASTPPPTTLSHPHSHSRSYSHSHSHSHSSQSSHSSHSGGDHGLLTPITPITPNAPLIFDNESLENFVCEAFPDGTDEYTFLRDRLRAVMQAPWKIENQLEEDENDLLQFTVKKNGVWRCLFYDREGNQCTRCQCRKIQALEHMRRHIKHEPFICAGEPCRRSDDGCGQRYSSPDPLRKHRAEKVKCNYCHKQILPGNIKRHQDNNCHDS